MSKKSHWFVLVSVLAIFLSILACSNPLKSEKEGATNDGGEEILANEPEDEGLTGDPVEQVQPSPEPAQVEILQPESGEIEIVEEVVEEEPEVEEIVPVVTETPTTAENFEPRINPFDGAMMVYVPAGEFLMGSKDYLANGDERPAHLVYLDAYWLYMTPVTNAQYRQCISVGVCEGNIARYPQDDLPAVNVSWFDASTYCEWAQGRLPSEAEWEKGARGTDERIYPWGNEAPTCDLANYKNCYKSKEIAVGSLRKNVSPYGALDMVGNVWEWVGDWYAPDYYALSPYSNPMGPEYSEGDFRVQRGSCFESEADALALTIRSRAKPEKADYRKGFRCIVTELP